MLLAGLDSFSDWLKSSPSRDKQTSATQQQHATSSLTTKTSYSSSGDRLLHSEVKELQSKVTSLERENHELRQLLAKSEGVDPSHIRPGRQVHWTPVPLVAGVVRYM